jgi:uncharacterized membrane protein YkoI
MLRWLAIPSLALILAVPAEGQPSFVAQPQPGAEAPEREPGPADLEEAVEIAIKRYGGEAVRSDTVEREGRQVHEIRLLLEDSRVRTVRIDPATGKIIVPREQEQR